MLAAMRLIICFATLLLSLDGLTTPPAKLAICASCHGLNGVATQKEYPNIAGQSANYLLKQLQDYQNKTRTSAIMQAFVMGLTEKEMLELSKYYSNISQNTSHHTATSHKSGEILYKIGNRSKGVTACIACHGPKGQGNDPAKYPKLSGQHQDYLEDQLHAFKHQTRKNDPKAIMQKISAHLSDKEIRDLISYIQQLP